MPKNTTSLLTNLYPLVSKALSSRQKEYRNCIGRFINNRFR